MSLSPERARQLQAKGAAVRRANRARRDAAAELARSADLLDHLDRAVVRLEDLTEAQRRVVETLIHAAEGEAKP